jgi:hypothetical protein
LEFINAPLVTKNELRSLGIKVFGSGWAVPCEKVSKRPIKGSEFSDTNLEYLVCSHLQRCWNCGGNLEILLIIQNGSIKLEAGPRALVRNPIDFHLIEPRIQTPKFIELRHAE